MFPGMSRSSVSAVWSLSRTSSGAPDVGSLRQRASSFGASVNTVGRAVLLVVRDVAGLHQYVLVPPGDKAAMLVGNLASAVGAKHARTEAVPDLTGTQAVGRLRARPDRFASRDTQSGGDPSEVARALERALPVGGWVAVSCRKATRAERDRTRRWFTHRLSGAATHYVYAGESVVTSVIAGGPDAASVESVLTNLAAALPGFDIDTSVQAPTGELTVRGLAGLATVGGPGLAYAASMVPAHVPAWAFAAAAVPGAATLAGSAAGVVRSPARRLFERVDRLDFPPPPSRHRPPARPRKEGTDRQGRSVRERSGDYPLAPTSLLMDPAMIVGVASPYTGGAGESTTVMRQPSAALLLRVGPMVGWAGEDEAPVHVSSVDAYAGVAMFGAPGSGKSALVESMFAFDLAASRGLLSAPGHPGSRNTIVNFESKGGLREYRAWCEQFGVSPVVIDAAAASGHTIDVTDPGNGDRDPEARATALVDAVVFVFGETSVGPRSQTTLKSLLPMAFCMTEQDAVAAGVRPGSFMHYLGLLLHLSGDQPAFALVNAFTDRATRSKDPVLLRAVELGNVVYGAKVTPSERRNLVEAPRSKVEAMLRVPQFWGRPGGKSGRWSTLLNRHVPVLVNLGQPLDGTSVMDSESARLFGGLLLFSLRRAVMTTCHGWQEQGRAVTVMSDELGVLAGSSPEVLAWFRQQGRSFGVRVVMATQIPDQLEPGLRAALYGFGTMFWFTQSATGVIAEAVADLGKDGTSWSQADVANLEPFHAIMRTQVEGRKQSPVPVRLAYWGRDSSGADRRGQFIADQSGSV